MRKRNLRILALACLVCMLIPVLAQAKTPYKTFTVNGYDEMQETQTAYTVNRILSLDEVILGQDSTTINELDDLFIDGDGTLYVAAVLWDDMMVEEYGAVMVISPEGKLTDIVRTNGMSNPKGVFKAPNGHLYVADPEATVTTTNPDGEKVKNSGAVFEFDEKYKLVHAYTKPTNPLYGASTAFKPMKVAVNHAGILYVICDGNANGIVEISPGSEGEEDAFLGYFGTNYASVGVWDIFLRSIRTAEQRAMSGNSTNPRSPTNLDIDERGLIYTVTQGDGRSTLKRLNIAGSNLIGDAMTIDKPAGVAAGNNDNVYVADEDGFLYEFSSEGELIFVFGGKDDGSSRAGLFTKVAAVDVGPDGYLYALDSSQKTVTVFEPTEFTAALHDALALYAGGRYTESKEPLDQVLDMNSMFDVANRAMGRAYFQEENYDEALRYARLAKDKEGYSDAYWEVRNVWLKRSIATVFIVIIALAVIWWIVKLLDRKLHFLDKIKPKGKWTKRFKYLSDLRYSFFYMKHPIDGSYGIAREGRASWAVSLTLLVLFIVEFLINKYFCGFLQKTVQDGRFEIFSDVGVLLAAVVALVGCNYLVCTINEGEGTVKKIASYFCYSLTPYIILTPVIFLLSQVLTNNEQFLITMIQIVAYAWMAVLLVIGIREVNNYTGKQTLKVILLTLFTVLILALIVFILYILWAQVFKFFGEIFGEVVYRFG